MLDWLKNLRDNLSLLAGEDVRDEVMAGCEGLADDPAPEELAEWFRGAVDRMDGLAEEGTRKRVMMDSSPDVFPPERIEAMRERYKEKGDLDDLIGLMHGDDSWHGLSWYEYPERRGDSIFVRKIPFDPEGYDEATDPDEKRYHYCHCRVVKAVMRAGETISPTFCFCGANWYRQLWEGILGAPVEIEVLRTVAQGDDACEFLIHIPSGE